MTKYKCNTDELMRFTKGKVYECELHENGLHLWVTCDDGEMDFIHKDWFDIVEDYVIEVGSEWVANDVVDGEGVVKYTSDKSVLIDIVNGGEQLWSPSQFLRTFKPKPKTVTMYFYKDCKGLVHSYSEPMPVFGDYLFTKEIEL